MPNIKETPYVRLEIEDGILIGYYKEGIKINLEIAKQIVKDRREFTEFKRVPALAINLGVKNLNKEARDYLASAEGVAGVSAGAIITGSPVGSFIGNFYLSV